MSEKRYLVKSISNDTQRFILAHDFIGWHAEAQALCGDGSWLRTWYSDTFPNQLGARQAITWAFGV